MRASAALAALLALLAAAAAAAAPRAGPALRCAFTESRRCEPGRDCVEAGDFGTWTILDEAAGVYHNCGPGPAPGSCITSPAHFGKAGTQRLVQDVDYPLSVTVTPEGEATEVSVNGPSSSSAGAAARPSRARAPRANDGGGAGGVQGIADKGPGLCCPLGITRSFSS